MRLFKSKSTISFTKDFTDVFGFQFNSFLAFFEFPKSVSTSKGLKYSLLQAIIHLPFSSKHFSLIPFPFQKILYPILLKPNL